MKKIIDFHNKAIIDFPPPPPPPHRVMGTFGETKESIDRRQAYEDFMRGYRYVLSATEES